VTQRAKSLGIGSKARIRPVPHNIDTEIRVAVAFALCMSGYVTLAYVVLPPFGFTTRIDLACGSGA
jgi:hypothetical protein